MRVLAIDPGFGRCGVAVLEKVREKRLLGREQHIYSACIETSASLPFPERLRLVGDEVARLIATYHPDAIALERLYFNTNQKTAMQVAEVRGAILYVAAHNSIPSFEYTPGQVKNAAAGWGSADKEQVATMLRALVTIEKEIRHDDEYDAIAVGITHLAHTRQLHGSHIKST